MDSDVISLLSCSRPKSTLRWDCRAKSARGPKLENVQIYHVPELHVMILITHITSANASVFCGHLHHEQQGHPRISVASSSVNGPTLRRDANSWHLPAHTQLNAVMFMRLFNLSCMPLVSKGLWFKSGCGGRLFNHKDEQQWRVRKGNCGW